MSAIEDIAAERQRQIEAEGWSTDHDDQHADQSLAAAAACYAYPFRVSVICDWWREMRTLLKIVLSG